jgi:hypothetical protein
MKRVLRKIKVPPATSTMFIPVVIVVGIVVLFAQMYWTNKNPHLFMPFSIDRVRCVLCSGIGVQRDPSDNSRLVICPSCFGVGYKAIRRVDKDDALCAACGGMGRVEEDDGKTWRNCRRCDGRGLIRETPWFVSGSIKSNLQERLGVKPAP